MNSYRPDLGELPDNEEATSNEKFSYWEECIAVAFEEAGITATSDQIKLVADSVEVSHDNYGMAHGLEIERRKETCPECGGKGSTTSDAWNGCGRSNETKEQHKEGAD